MLFHILEASRPPAGDEKWHMCDSDWHVSGARGSGLGARAWHNTSVLTHIVCFKYKPDISQSTREEHRSRLRGLHTIDGVVNLTVGADVVRSPRSYDTGLIVVFRDRAALDAYQTNPQHVPVAQFGVSLCENIVAVDFM